MRLGNPAALLQTAKTNKQINKRIVTNVVLPEHGVGDAGGGLRELDEEVLVEGLGHLVVARQHQPTHELVVRVRPCEKQDAR